MTGPEPQPGEASQFAELQQLLAVRSREVALAGASNTLVREMMEENKSREELASQQKALQDQSNKREAIAASRARAEGLPDPRYYPQAAKIAQRVKRATSAAQVRRSKCDRVNSRRVPSAMSARDGVATSMLDKESFQAFLDRNFENAIEKCNFEDDEFDYDVVDDVDDE